MSVTAEINVFYMLSVLLILNSIMLPVLFNNSVVNVMICIWT